MFEEYKKEVLKSYFLKKAQKELSSSLESPARLKLKKECLRIFAEKYTKMDDDMLKAFFDPSSKFNDHVKSIEKFELDKFRPLISFLQKGTNIRDEESVKLLAWLIDFESYRNWRCKEDKEDPEPSPAEGVPSENSIDELNPVIRKYVYNGPGGLDVVKEGRMALPNGRQSLIKRIMLGSIVFFVFGGAVFYFSGYKMVSSVREPLVHEKCMYWTGEHYEPVECGKKIKDAIVIPLDLGALYGLKRINSTDTLTKYSLGKVWYSKIGGKHEFFTDSGMHPVDTGKRLKPITKYILSNYVSYDRYLLTRLVWSVGISITVAVSVGVVYLLQRKKGSI